MRKHVIVVSTFAVGVLLAVAAALAESRGKPRVQDQMLAAAEEVFVGEVLEVRTFEKHRRTVPTKVRVLLGIKGAVKPGEREVTVKDPGVAVYFDEEFDKAAERQVGVFYVGTKERANLLMGYRRIVLKN